MNATYRRLLAAACLLGGLTATGCVHKYADVVDPCYPNRYIHASRAEVIGAMYPQVMNGRILDQTLWNYHFERGTATLNFTGMDKLDILVRRRPQPDTQLYLATARDLDYDGQAPDKYSDGRRELDQKRIAAIQAYMSAQTSGRALAFEVCVHDPIEPSISAQEANVARSVSRQSATGTIGAGLGSAGGSAAVSGVTGAINISNQQPGGGGGGGGTTVGGGGAGGGGGQAGGGLNR